MARQNSSLLEKILHYDVILTKRCVESLLQYGSFKSLRVHFKFLEISCNGIFWLSMWLGFIWIFNNKDLYQMQLNMLFGLFLDIIFVALLKAFVRRRRPSVCQDMLTLGPDKFSFPSGHASRAFLIVMFFTYLCPVSVLWWPPIFAWAGAVTLSRLILNRHYLLDVTAGILLGVLEAVVLQLLWLSKDTSYSVIEYISNDYLPGGSE